MLSYMAMSFWCDYIKGLEVGRLSCVIRVGPKGSYKFPYKRKAEGGWPHTEKMTK